MHKQVCSIETLDIGSLAGNLEQMACKKKSRPSSNDDPDRTLTQAKRPHVHVHTEPGAVTTPGLERERRRLLYVWQQESDSFLCNKIVTVRVRVSHNQLQIDIIPGKTL